MIKASRLLFKVAILSIVFRSILCFNAPVWAMTFHSPVEYSAFFSSTDNFLRLKPALLKSLFFEIAELKPNNQKQRQKIEKELFSCKTGLYVQSCILDQLRLERKKHRIQNSFDIPINITHLSRKSYRKGQSLLIVQWGTIDIPTTKLTREKFLELLQIAEDTRDFYIPDHIQAIHFNVVVENNLPLLIPVQQAKNLEQLYKRPPKDYRDRIYFKLERHSFSRYKNSLGFHLHFKAKRIVLNHQTFSVESEQPFIK